MTDLASSSSYPGAQQNYQHQKTAVKMADKFSTQIIIEGATNVQTGELVRKEVNIVRKEENSVRKEENVLKKKEDTNKMDKPNVIALAKDEMDHEAKAIKLKYVLNELKNLRVARENAKRSMEPQKETTDDVNILLNLNSAHYLAVKEELSKLDPGSFSELNNVKMELLESIKDQSDEVYNNPVSLMKWKVSQTIQGNMTWETTTTMLMYHTKQRIHLQGGRRNGDVTSVSLAADFMEGWCKIIFETHREKIHSVKEALLTMDLRKNYGGMQLRQKFNQTKENEKTLFKCELCHYKLVHKTDLVRHSYAIHQTKTASPESVKETDGTATKRKSVQFSDSSKMPRVLEGVPEEEEEYHTECLLCKLECKNELDLNEHIKYIHTIPQNSKNFIQSWDKEDQKEKEAQNKLEEQNNKEELRGNVTNTTPEADSKDEKIEELKLKLSKAEQDLELLSLKVTDLTFNLEIEKEEKNQALKGKLEAEKGYQEAAKVIDQQTRKVIESNEHIKVLQALVDIEKKKREQDGWEEVWQEDEDGNMVPEERREVGQFKWVGKPDKIVCKKCDKLLQMKMPTGNIFKSTRECRALCSSVTIVTMPQAKTPVC